MKSSINSRITIYRETIVDQLVRILQNRILNGELKPKTRISEAGVAKEFGISRVPAREALQRLEDMKLIKKNHLGREVTELSPEEFKETYELKNVIEAYGAMHGAMKAQADEIAKIRSTVNLMEKFTSENDLNSLRYINYEFHDLLVSCCRNKLLIDTYQSLVKQIRWATSLSLELPMRPKESFREHKEIFEAFINKNAKKVRVLLEKHSNENMKRVLSQMEKKWNSHQQSIKKKRK